jgi:phage gp29-like protein
MKKELAQIKSKLGEVKNFAEKSGIPAISTAPQEPSYVNPPDPYIGAENTTNDVRFKVTSKKPYIGEVVTRSTVWDYFRTTVALPNPSIILQKLGKGVEAYDDLLADARVKACLNNRRAGTLSQKWQIDQNNAPVRIYKTVQKIFDQFNVPNVMSEMLMAPFYGYNVTEVIWGRDGGMIIPVSLVGKAARWFFWSDLNELRYRTKVNMTLGEVIPPRKFLVAQYHPRYEDPYSGNESLASACYWPVHFRRLLLSYATTFIERYATPWLDVEMETGLQQERLKEILDVLQQTYQDGIVAHPANTKIQALGMGEHRSMENYTMYMDMLNREIDMAVLGSNLSAEVKGGSFAATSAHMDVRQDIIDEDTRIIENAMNQLIEWIAWYNWSADVELPEFKLYKKEVVALDRANIDMTLAKMGVKFSKKYFERAYQINSEEFEIGMPLPASGAGTGTAGGAGGAVAGAVTATAEEGVGVTAQANDEIEEAGIGTADSAVNQATKEAVAHAQKKGYPV